MEKPDQARDRHVQALIEAATNRLEDRVHEEYIKINPGSKKHIFCHKA